MAEIEYAGKLVSESDEATYCKIPNIEKIDYNTMFKKRKIKMVHLNDIIRILPNFSR